jgi:molybdopterin-guanine dinucleotide biosynthesis protein A
MNRSGVVLAGGASRRFGGDKLAEPIDGISLLERSIAALAGLVDEVIVVVAPNRPAPALEAGGTTRIRVVADPEPFGGPLAGLRTGLNAAGGATVIVVGGDMPSMRPAVLELLLGQPPAALGDQAGVLRPLPCSLDRAAALLAADALLASGERRLRALLTGIATKKLAWSDWQALDPTGLTLVDIDERSDVP